ncbi:MAG: hypothetical protein ACJA1A_002955 [Saprospiraceae bacterium]|jgi:hypothetical protein
MRTIITSIAFSIFSLTMVFGQNDVDFSAGDSWVGYMNVFNLNGGYEFGSSWEVSALKTTLDASANTIVLQPNFNTYAENAADAYWVNQSTGEGEKTMEALTFVEPGAFFNGQDLTFSGAVQSNTLDNGYAAKYFIKALNPDNDYADELAGAGVFDLPASGNFSVSIPGSSLTPGLVIQYGFSVTGRNANPANEADLGRVLIGAGSVSVNDLKTLKAVVSVYPNPTNDILSFKADIDVQSYEVSNLLGQTLLSGSATTNVDVSRLATGNYIITIHTAEGSKLMQFVKE